MDTALQLRTPIPASYDGRIACYLGSFDPPHFGHLALAQKLQTHADTVLLLVPAWHLEKRSLFPFNATLDQRMVMVDAMVNAMRVPNAGQVRVGVTQVVLFLGLDKMLRERYPNASVSFGMGDETLSRVLASRSAYHRLGIPWGPEQSRQLPDLVRRCHVWNRSGKGTGRDVDPTLAAISSTKVRACAQGLWQRGADDREWDAAMGPLVPASVQRAIRSWGLYRTPPGRDDPCRELGHTRSLP